MQPVGHTLLHTGERRIERRGATQEQDAAAEDVCEPPRGDVDHAEKDPEVQERAAEVAGLEEHEHGGAPDREQGPEVLEAPLCEHLALLAQVAGEEEDEEQLCDLAGLELEAADVDPEPHAVDALAETGKRREKQQADRRDAEAILIQECLECLYLQIIQCENIRLQNRAKFDEADAARLEHVDLHLRIGIDFVSEGTERKHRSSANKGSHFMTRVQSECTTVSFT